MTLNKKQIDALIARRHKGYEASAKVWRFLEDVMTMATPDFAEEHLEKHRTEYDDSFEARKRRAFWIQITRSIRESFVNHLFKVPGTFGGKEDANGKGKKTIPPAVQAFYDEATRDGRGFLDLLEEIAEYVLQDGVLWLGLDRPDVDPGPTKATEEAAGVKTYGYPVRAIDMLDGRFECGQLVWCLVRECFVDNEDPLNSSGRVLERFRLWTAEESIAIVPDMASMKGTNGKPKYIAEAPVPHPCGRPPFAFFPIKKRPPCFAMPGLLQSVAYTDREVFNLCSQYATILTKQTFSQLAIPSADPLVSEDDDDLTEAGEAVIRIGEEEVFTFDPKSSAPPVWVAAPDGPAKTLKEAIGYLFNLCFMQACLDAEHNAGAEHSGQGAHTNGATPGVTMAYVYDKLDSRLVAIASALQAGADDAFELVQAWEGKLDDDTVAGLLVMPDSFDVKTLAQDLLEDAQLKAFGIPSPTFEALVMKELVRKRFPDLEQETLDTIDGEIEEGDPYATIAGGKALDMMGAPGSQNGQQGGQPGKPGQPDPGKGKPGFTGKPGKQNDSKQKPPGFKGA